MRRAMSGVIAAMLLLLGSSVSAEEAAYPGRSEFVQYCSACHGEAADGNGPVANVLDPRPPALTRLREKYGNPLSTELVVYISGTTMPRAHGKSEMPVWGRVLKERTGNEEETSSILWRIVRYLDSIQQPDPVVR